MNRINHFAKAVFISIFISMFISCGSTHTSVSGSLADAKVRNCAIAGFTFTDMKNGKELPNIAAEFSDALSPFLIESGFKMIERVRLDLLMKESTLQHSGITDPAEAVKFGKMASVKFVLFGSGRCNPSGSGNEYFLHEATVKMVDVESGEQVIAASWSGAGVRPIGVAENIGRDISARMKGK